MCMSSWVGAHGNGTMAGPVYMQSALASHCEGVTLHGAKTSAQQAFNLGFHDSAAPQ